MRYFNLSNNIKTMLVMCVLCLWYSPLISANNPAVATPYSSEDRSTSITPLPQSSLSNTNPTVVSPKSGKKLSLQEQQNKLYKIIINNYTNKATRDVNCQNFLKVLKQPHVDPFASYKVYYIDTIKDQLDAEDKAIKKISTNSVFTPEYIELAKYNYKLHQEQVEDYKKNSDWFYLGSEKLAPSLTDQRKHMRTVYDTMEGVAGDCPIVVGKEIQKILLNFYLPQEKQIYAYRVNAQPSPQDLLLKHLSKLSKIKLKTFSTAPLGFFVDNVHKSTPALYSVYKYNNNDEVSLSVKQVFKNSVVVGNGYSSKSIMIQTANSYVDEDFLADGYYVYLGVTKYTGVWSTTSTVYNFKELPKTTKSLEKNNKDSQAYLNKDLAWIDLELTVEKPETPEPLYPAIPEKSPTKLPVGKNTEK